MGWVDGIGWVDGMGPIWVPVDHLCGFLTIVQHSGDLHMGWDGMG